MILDINSELRDFTYITSVYKCISNYKLKGHQIGRKIGDMLEILTMGAIYENRDLLDRLSTEDKLEGYTTAGHKVEFCFYNNPHDRNKQLFGAIECKCVGVEETTSGKGNKFRRNLARNESFDIEISGRWQSSPITFTFTLINLISDTKARVRVTTDTDPALNTTFDFSINEGIQFIVDENETPIVTTPHGNMLDEVPGIIRVCKTIKFEKITGNIATFGLYDCLTGPQTIEKAKQASLVAMDLRKKVDGYWGKEDVPAGQKRMNFVLVISEYSHWEEKSRNVINCCIDHTVIVPDAVINKAFEIFEERFGLSEMLDKISKDSFKNNPSVRSAINEVLNFYENRIFYDVDLKQYVKFNYQNNLLVIQPIR